MRLSLSKQSRKSAPTSAMTKKKAEEGSETNDVFMKRTSRMSIEEMTEEAAGTKRLNRLGKSQGQATALRPALLVPSELADIVSVRSW